MQETMETLWQDYRARLLAFIRARVSDDDAADDLLQEVFLRIHTRMHTLKDADRLESWIYQITRNAIVDYYRAGSRLTPLPETLPAESEPEIIATPDSADEIAASIRSLVEALPEPYRQALILTEFEGLSQQELANHLGISLSGAKSRVQRARQKIKDGLMTCCHFEFDRYGRIIDYWQHCCCCCNPDCE